MCGLIEHSTSKHFKKAFCAHRSSCTFLEKSPATLPLPSGVQQNWSREVSYIVNPNSPISDDQFLHFPQSPLFSLILFFTVVVV